MFNSISNHFQSEGIPEKLADYMSDFLTVQVHHHAIVLAEILREEFGPAVEDNKPFICQAREEAKLQAMMINDISIASGMSSEVVRRVLDAQVEVLDLD